MHTSTDQFILINFMPEENHKNELGRTYATGKFNTSEELIENVMRLRIQRKMSFASVARCCHVSRTTVIKILDNHNKDS